jgi:hypothetical protein
MERMLVVSTSLPQTCVVFPKWQRGSHCGGLSVLNSNNVDYIYISTHSSPDFWDTNWRTADLSTAEIPPARDGSASR